jgi:type IV secretion system protein VirD4
VIAEETGRSDWRIEDLVSGDQPLSLYLVVPPSDLSRTKPLIRLILNQIGRRLTEDLPEQNRRKLLLMLDEFPALGRLDFFESALAFMAGYGIRAYLIAQSLNQIEKAYGPNNSILDNCHVRIAFATNDERTAKRVSDALGTTTELRAQKNYTGHRLAPWLSHMMVSRQETQRALVTPGEVMQLAASDEIVMVSGAPPALAKKLRYFEDGNFTRRVLPPTNVAWEAENTTGPWTGMVLAPPTSNSSSAEDETAHGLALKRTREPDRAPQAEEAAIEPAIGDAPDLEDAADPSEDRNLDMVRRAVAADRGDPDVLPEF